MKYATPEELYHINVTCGQVPFHAVRQLWTNWTKKQRLEAILSLCCWHADGQEMRQAAIKFLTEAEID